jgi:hypothetical protein
MVPGMELPGFESDGRTRNAAPAAAPRSDERRLNPTQSLPASEVLSVHVLHATMDLGLACLFVSTNGADGVGDSQKPARKGSKKSECISTLRKQ